MGGYLARLFDRRQIQPSLIKSAWAKCIAKNKQGVFNTVLVKLCLMDGEMATILRTSAGHAASRDEADFVMKQLAERIACFFETLIAGVRSFKSLYKAEFHEMGYDKLRRKNYVRFDQHIDCENRISLSKNLQDGVLNNPHEFNQACFHLGQQHAGFSRNEFQLPWWELFVDTLLLEFHSATPDEQKAWKNLLSQVSQQMKIGYQKARANMRRHS